MTPKFDLVTLRPDQTLAIDRLRQGIARKLRRQVLSAPTGSGKTEIAKAMIASAYGKGSKALFMVDGLTLFEQTSRRFWDSKIPHGVLGGGENQRRTSQVIVAMKQTLMRMPKKDLLAFFDSFDVIFDDECHRIYQKITEAELATRACLIGLSATPMTKGLGKIYEDVVNVTTTNSLMDNGDLTRMLIRSAVEIDMSGAPVNAGEWAASEVRERGRAIIGDIVSTWVAETQAQFGGPVKTMLFSADIAHGEELCREFQAAGHDFRQVTAYSNSEYRDRTMEEFRHGKFPGVVSCDALGRGVDIPDVKCIVIARPYRKAIMAHLQMLGRAMRKSPGKTVALVLDHSGNCLGFYDATEEFFANGVTALDDGKFQDVKRSEKPNKERLCLGCSTILPPSADHCPMCGLVRKRRKSEIERVPGSMITIEAISRGKGDWTGTPSDLWQACCAAAQEWQFRKGNHHDREKMKRQAKANYFNLTGQWPSKHLDFLPAKYVPKPIRRKLDQKYREWLKRKRAA